MKYNKTALNVDADHRLRVTEIVVGSPDPLVNPDIVSAA